MKKEEYVSYISPRSLYEGKVDFYGILRVDGIIVGEVNGVYVNESSVSEGLSLVVGKSGKISGKVKVSQLIVEGSCEGDFYVSQKAEFIAGSKFKGKLFTPVLVVQEGATIEGSINVPDEKAVVKSETVEYGLDPVENEMRSLDQE